MRVDVNFAHQRFSSCRAEGSGNGALYLGEGEGGQEA